MKVDIYIKEKTGSREVRIPWLPEQIQFECGGISTASYDIMNRGEVAVPTGSGLARVSWSSEFPGEYRKGEYMMRGSWKAPKNYHNIFMDWRNNGTPLNLLVIGYPINLDVHLEDYKATASGAFGDIIYNVSFIENRDIKITSTKVAAQASSSAANTKRPATTKTTYTIKSGDTLWGIAKRFLGSGAKWKTIYDANKSIIESTAKKRRKGKGSDNGHWIYPGTTLTIPGASAGNGNSSTNKKPTLTVVHKGEKKYWGSFAVNLPGNTPSRYHYNAINKSQYTFTVNAGTKAQIVPMGRHGYSFNISAKEVTINKDTTVTITWHR